MVYKLHFLHVNRNFIDCKSPNFETMCQAESGFTFMNGSPGKASRRAKLTYPPVSSNMAVMQWEIP